MNSAEQMKTMDIERRRRWIGLLAKATLQELEQGWSQIESKPEYTFIRVPETGQIMIRARTGGVGPQFNLGEMTMSRCAVRLANGYIGFGYTAKHQKRHAELAAVFDAMMQDPVYRSMIETTVIEPVADREQHIRSVSATKIASTNVEFFTLVRGDD
jgi:alpha-D-ribose 1-methylphosphonate 5-triphosphate synthase subunit PhnG